MKGRARTLAGRWLFVALGVAAVWVATDNRLAGPPIRHPGRMGAWWRSEGPIVAVFSMGRCVLLLAGCYWLALLTLAIAGAAGGPGLRVLRQLTRCHLPGSRLAVNWTAGLSAAGSVLLNAGAAGAAAAPVVQPPQLRNLAPAGSGVPAPGPAGPATGGDQPPVLRYLGPAHTEPPDHARPSPAVDSRPQAAAGPVTSTTTPAQPAGGTPSPSPAPRATSGQAPAGRPAPLRPRALPPRANPPRNRTAGTVQPVPTDDRPHPQPAAQWTVRPGDDFWSISESTLSAAWGRQPTVREIGPYWLAVIAANQDRLPDPGNPNLLFPGDVIVLPIPPRP